MGHFTSGVTIVTTSDGERRYGMTVASFASLSLRPPLVLVCIGRRAEMHDAIPRTGHFAISILERSQSLLSSRFASPVDDRFDGVDVRDGALGDPLIDGALVNLQCRLHSTADGGDHTIFIGEVVEARVREADPLVYFRSGYRDLADF